MEDLGPPIAYTALPEGIPAYDRNGNRIGVVDKVVADFQADIFEGLVVHTTPLPRRHLFAAPDQIDSMHERGVVLAVEVSDLQERGESSHRGREEDDQRARSLAARLARIWDRIAGRG